MKLFQFNPFPPGGFPYEQSVNGKVYKWPDVGLDIVEQSKKIFSFRKSNKLERATLAEVVEDVNIYTCRRLGNDPRFCGDGTNRVTASITQQPIGGCMTCIH